VAFAAHVGCRLAAHRDEAACGSGAPATGGQEGAGKKFRLADDGTGEKGVVGR
jgi:hypothetical protein